MWGVGIGGVMGAGPTCPSAGNQPPDVSPGGREELIRGSRVRRAWSLGKVVLGPLESETRATPCGQPERALPEGLWSGGTAAPQRPCRLTRG